MKARTLGQQRDKQHSQCCLLTSVYIQYRAVILRFQQSLFLINFSFLFHVGYMLDQKLMCGVVVSFYMHCFVEL